MFNLGERAKVAVISTPDGEDKPLKYSHIFRAAGIVIINKIDLAPHVGFDEALCRANITRPIPMPGSSASRRAPGREWRLGLIFCAPNWWRLRSARNRSSEPE